MSGSSSRASTITCRARFTGHLTGSADAGVTCPWLLHAALSRSGLASFALRIRLGACRPHGGAQATNLRLSDPCDRDGAVWVLAPRHDHNGMALGLDGAGAAAAVSGGEGAFWTRRGRLTGEPGTLSPGTPFTDSVE